MRDAQKDFIQDQKIAMQNIQTLVQNQLMMNNTPQRQMQIVDARSSRTPSPESGVPVTDLASLAVASEMTEDCLATEVDPDGADFAELCASLGVTIAAKIKIKAELRAARA